MNNGQIPSEVEKLLKRLIFECTDRHENSHHNDEGERLNYFCLFKNDICFT